MEQPTIYIIFGNYYSYKESRVVYGGTQTYITSLIPLFKKKGYRCIICQPSNIDKKINLDYCIVQFVNTRGVKSVKKETEIVLKSIEQVFNNNTDILMFETDARNIKNKAKRSISIQHGIYWDIPCHEEYSTSRNALYVFQKVRDTYKIIKRNSYVKHLVCVDYNFVNWYKAVSAYPAIKLIAIPNFTEISPVVVKPTNVINIIFARRLRKYRGANLFADAMAILLPKYPNVHLTIAGVGPEEEYMRKVLSAYSSQVEFTQYKAEDSLKIHQDKHIAVVPTIGSEGTSLSLLEAMSSQCAVVCTSVGGMSNIVIDNFNGLITDTTIDSLVYALEKLILNKELRYRLATNGYETVKQGFSIEKWRNSWEKVIDDVINIK